MFSNAFLIVSEVKKCRFYAGFYAVFCHFGGLLSPLRDDFDSKVTLGAPRECLGSA
jgi:hypothetical protein